MATTQSADHGKGAWAAVVSIAIILASEPARAVPSFARQTGEQCVACHVGAFGPQLTQHGREFKLNGYVWNDGSDQIPLAAMVQTSFTHTNTDQPGATPHFGPNDNFAIDQISLFLAGRLTDKAGAFIQTTYDGVGRNLTWDNLDLRYADKARLGGTRLLYGVTINNNPTVQDVWNSTPAWAFPFAASHLAPSPAAGTLIDGGLAQQVIGAGGYALWNDLIYVEADLYNGLGRDVRNALGVVPVSGSNSVDGVIPYWRVALQHNFGDHYLEVGSFGLSGGMFPAGDKSIGRPDHFTDVGLDATYLYTGDRDNIFTGYATYIHEHQSLDSSFRLLGSNSSNSLTTFRLNGSYSYHNTFTFSAQRFQTRGSADGALYPGNGSPNSAGYIAEIAYVPSGKLGSWVPSWINARLSLQYTAYTQFNGTTVNASDNNSVFALLWLAF